MSTPIEWDHATEKVDPPSAQSPTEPCPACGEAPFRSLFSAHDVLCEITNREFQLVECQSCRLIRLHPQPLPEQLRDYYPDEYWLEPDRPLHGSQEEGAAATIENIYRHIASLDLIRFVERSLEESGEPGLVLDVGPRGGLRLSLLAGRLSNPQAGLDFTVDAAQQTALKRHIPIVCGTLSRAPFTPGSCALLILFHVLEHLYDPVPYLNAARELLAPDGRLIVQVYNASSWQFLLFGDRWSGLNVPRHLIHFRRKDAELLLGECGFEILREKHFSWRDSPAACATSLAPSLDPSLRRLRRLVETPAQRAWKTAVYALLCGLCVPFTLLEASCRAGAAIVFEARKKS